MTFDYDFCRSTFTSIVKLAAEWTTDMRGLNANANPVYDALFKLKNWDTEDHSTKMTAEQQAHIVGCLKIVSWAAGHATNDSRVLAISTMHVLNGLNILFQKEGLIPVKGLYE